MLPDRRGEDMCLVWANISHSWLKGLRCLKTGALKNFHILRGVLSRAQDKICVYNSSSNLCPDLFPFSQRESIKLRRNSIGSKLCIYF